MTIGREVAAGAEAVRAAQAGSYAAHAVEVEREEIVEQIRIAAAGDLIEVLADRIGAPHVVREHRRVERDVGAPGVVLHGRERGTVLHLRQRDAEVQARVVGEIEVAAQLCLLDVHLHVAVAERRAGDRILRRVDGALARGQPHADHREVLPEVTRGIAAHEACNTEHGVGAIRAVGAGFSARIVVIELEAETLGGLPLEVEAHRLVLVLAGELGAAHRQVAVGAGDQLGVHERACHRTVAPAAGRGTEVEPHRQLVALGLDLVLGVGVIERRSQRVHRTPLQGELTVGAFALDAVDAVAEVLRHRIDVGCIGTVGDAFGARLPRLRNRAPVVLVAGERAPAVADRCLVETGVALLVARGERDAELVVAERIAVDAGDFRRDLVALQVVRQVLPRVVDHAFQAEAGVQAGIVQRARRLDIDRRADAAGRRAGAAGLVDLDRGNRFRSEIREVEGARVGCDRVLDGGDRHLPAVQQHQVEVRADAANRDALAFADRGAVDGHAADALQRLGEVRVGKLADVFGDDAVDDALRIALQVHGRGETAADAGDDHLFQRFRGLLRERRQCDGGPENQRNGLCDGRTATGTIVHSYTP